MEILDTMRIGILMLALEPGGVQAQATGRCAADTWPEFERQVNAAQTTFQKGDPKRLQALWSHADDVTLMGALGGHERGWDPVGSRLAHISSDKRHGSHDDDQVITRVVGTDLALLVQLEHIVHRNADGTVSERHDLRVTHVARCERGAWRLIHRHADPLIESTLVPK